MSAVPTVRIKSDIPGCEAGLDINEADFDPAKHVLFDDGETPSAGGNPAATIGKGPGGKWYIRRGKKNEAGPFATEAEAQAALDEANAATPDGEQVEVPDEWEAMTEDEMIALAGDLIGEAVVASAETTVAEKARSIIAATVADRTSK